MYNNKLNFLCKLINFCFLIFVKVFFIKVFLFSFSKNKIYNLQRFLFFIDFAQMSPFSSAMMN